MPEDKLFFYDSPEEYSKFLDASYILTSREMESIDPHVYGVIRQLSILPSMIPAIKVREGAKSHIIAIEEEQDPPVFDDDFLTEDVDQVRKAESTFYTAYMHKDFVLSMVDMIASETQQYYTTDAKSLTIRGTTATIVDYKERVLFRGFDIKGRTAANKQGSINTKVKGILNTTNVQAFAAGAGADADVTAAGDGPCSVSAAIAALVAYDYYGPYWFVMTPLVYAQLINNFNATTQQTDIERMLSMVDNNKNNLLLGLKITKHLLNAAETTSTGAMLAFDPKTPAGEPTVLICEEFPIAYNPTLRNPYKIEGKVHWAGMAAVLRPYAFAAEDTIAS